MTQYYHGGHHGLRAGDKILPPEVTGVKAAVDFLPPGADPGYVRRDRVYITTDVDLARFFAAGVQGDVYAVIPDAPVEPDPDYLAEPCESWVCTSATITGAVQRNVGITPEAVAFITAMTYGGNK